MHLKNLFESHGAVDSKLNFSTWSGTSWTADVPGGTLPPGSDGRHWRPSDIAADASPRSVRRHWKADGTACSGVEPTQGGVRDPDGSKRLSASLLKQAAGSDDNNNNFIVNVKHSLYDKPKWAFADTVGGEHGRDLAAMAAHTGSHGARCPSARLLKDSNRTVGEMDNEEKSSKESSEKALAKTDKMALNLQVRRAHGPRLRQTEGLAGHRVKAFQGGVDAYNIETVLSQSRVHHDVLGPQEGRRRNDREEIRRRLAMGSEDINYYTSDQRPGKKPSLQARLQSGMNLQICFMNETLSDTESPGSESETPASGGSVVPFTSKALTPKMGASSERLPVFSSSKPVRPLSLPLQLGSDCEWREHSSLMTEADFLARQAQLQTEARMALAQAKDMAHMQMEIERQQQNASPVTEIVRHTLTKVGVSFPEDRRRLSRQILTEMNVAQLQVIVNDLHTQIEYLNETLVRFLMERDDLHMEQDSMLVDIEDLTRYLGAKEQNSGGEPNQNNNRVSRNEVGAGRVSAKK